MKPLPANYATTLAILIGNLFSIHVHSQVPDFQWGKGFGGTGTDVGLNLALDASNNVYAVGVFQGTADFDPGAGTFLLNSNGAYDISITKLDPAGNLIWAKSIGGTGSDDNPRIKIDGSGDLVITGTFRETVDFDPGPGVYTLTGFPNSVTTFILKLNSSGNFVWAKVIGGTNANTLLGAAIDAVGNIYVTSYFNGPTDFDPGAGVYSLTSVGASLDIFVLKLDPSGNFLWVKSMGGSLHDGGTCIDVDNFGSGSIYVSGEFEGTGDFDPGSGIFNMTSSGREDIFISKLDLNGNFIWAKWVGGSEQDFIYSIAVDPGGSGDIFLGGDYFGTADFDPGPATYNIPSHGATDIFVLKLSSAGNFMWANGIGANYSDVCIKVVPDPTGSGSVYAVGSFSQTADFDPGPGIYNLTSIGGSDDIYILKLTGSGSFEWVKQAGTFQNDYADGCSVDLNNRVYITGYFNDTTISFGGSTITNHGGPEMYVAKLDNCFIPSAVVSAGGQVTFCSGSSVTLNANIGTGLSYQWQQNSSAIPGATSSSYVASVAGSYTCQVTNNCGSTLSNPITVTVNTVTNSPGVISGQTSGVCSSTKTFSIASVSGATGYSWNAPSGSTLVSGQGTTSVSISFSSSFGAGNISVMAVNQCGNSLPRTLAVSGAPSQPAVISGPVSVCHNQNNVVYSIAAVQGATSYTWTVPPGANIKTGQGTTSIKIRFGNTAGNITVRANNSCGTSAIRSLAVSMPCREVEDLSSGEIEISIYPNPSTSNFTLKISSTENSDITFSIRDLEGRQVKNFKLLQQEDLIEFGEDLQPGIYLAEISTASTRKMIRIAKQ